MYPFSDSYLIQQIQKQQKVRFRSQIRAEKLSTIMSAKRNIFITNSLPPSFNINNAISSLFEAIDQEIIEEIVKNLQPINNFIYDCNKEEISWIFRRFSQEKKLEEILKILQENQENYSLFNEMSMLFVNFSALLEETEEILVFFTRIFEDFINIFKENSFLNMKNNILLCFGNLILKKKIEIISILIEEFGILDSILLIFVEHNSELNEIFIKTVIWFIEIILESSKNINVS